MTSGEMPPITRSLTSSVEGYRTHSTVGDLYHLLLQEANAANPYFQLEGSQQENTFSTLKCPDYDVCFSLDCGEIADCIRVEKSECGSDFYKIIVTDKKRVAEFMEETVCKFGKLFDLKSDFCVSSSEEENSMFSASAIRKISHGICSYLGLKPVSQVNAAAATLLLCRDSPDLSKALEKLEKLFEKKLRNPEVKTVLSRLRQYVLPFWAEFGFDLEVDIVPQFTLPYWVMPEEAFDWEGRNRKSKWPTKEIIEKVKEAGVKSVAKTNTEGHLGKDFRLSLSLEMLVAEIKYSKKVLVILKDLNHHFVQQKSGKDIGHALNSYHFKTSIAWVREKCGQEENLSASDLLIQSIDFLAKCFKRCNVPYYFNKNINLISDMDKGKANDVALQLQKLIKNSDLPNKIAELSALPMVCARDLSRLFSMFYTLRHNFFPVKLNSDVSRLSDILGASPESGKSIYAQIITLCLGNDNEKSIPDWLLGEAASVRDHKKPHTAASAGAAAKGKKEHMTVPEYAEVRSVVFESFGEYLRNKNQPLFPKKGVRSEVRRNLEKNELNDDDDLSACPPPPPTMPVVKPKRQSALHAALSICKKN